MQQVSAFGRSRMDDVVGYQIRSVGSPIWSMVPKNVYDIAKADPKLESRPVTKAQLYAEYNV